MKGALGYSQVLDGIGIAAAETTLAKETFTGKMTPELLAERAGAVCAVASKDIHPWSCRPPPLCARPFCVGKQSPPQHYPARRLIPGLGQRHGAHAVTLRAEGRGAAGPVPGPRHPQAGPQPAVGAAGHRGLRPHRCIDPPGGWGVTGWFWGEGGSGVWWARMEPIKEPILASRTLCCFEIKISVKWIDFEPFCHFSQYLTGPAAGGGGEGVRHA